MTLLQKRQIHILKILCMMLSLFKSRADVIAPGREIVAESGLYITKKRYAALVYDVEGFQM